MLHAYQHPPVPVITLFLRMGGWFVIAAGVAMVIFSFISTDELRMAKRFDAEGRPAIADVTRRYTTTERDSDGDDETLYWLELRFETRDGQQIDLTREATHSEYRRAKAGGTYEIFYLQSAPETIELTRGSHKSASRVTQIIALVLGISWLIALWVVGGWAVSGARARKYGTRELATVTEILETSVTVNDKPRYRLVWKDAKGRRGQSLLKKWDDINVFKPGDQITIYQGVKRAWWAGDVGFRPEAPSP